MPKYSVLLARDASESTRVVVEAASQQEANAGALELAGRWGEKLTTWELDEGNLHDVYVADPDETHAVEEDD